MGLDITAYRGLRRVECDDTEYGCDHLQPYDNPDFPGRMAGLEEGHYEAADSFGFRAGSYSGYNQWREGLATLAGLPSPREVWENPDAYAGKPFVELVNFSDCEGTIGPVVSAKLARDFAEWDDRAKAQMDDYEYGRYAGWRRAFKLAANNGAVDFH
jgi:hypothetical protein